MGFIDLEDQDNGKRYLPKLKAALARRGLKPDTSVEWEIHGPHPNMDYQVLIGWVFDDQARYLVAVYPRGVYEIEDESSWWKVKGADRIPVNR